MINLNLQENPKSKFLVSLPKFIEVTKKGGNIWHRNIICSIACFYLSLIGILWMCHNDFDLHNAWLGLNIVVGLAGLDLGYVAFYAVGAYSYA